MVNGNHSLINTKNASNTDIIMFEALFVCYNNFTG